MSLAFQRRINIQAALLVLLVLPLVMSYTLEGQWRLTEKHLNYTNQNPRTIFHFAPVQDQGNQNLPSNNGHNNPSNEVGRRQLTVFACKQLRYNYVFNETSIYFSQIDVQ